MQRDRRGKRHLMHLARSAAMAALWALILLVAVEPGVRAQAPNRAGIVIDYGTAGRRTLRSLAGWQRSGRLELLDELRRQTGLSVSIEPFPGKGNAVCRIRYRLHYAPRELLLQVHVLRMRAWSWIRQAGGVEYLVIGPVYGSAQRQRGRLVVERRRDRPTRRERAALLTFDEICNSHAHADSYAYRDAARAADRCADGDAGELDQHADAHPHGDVDAYARLDADRHVHAHATPKLSCTSPWTARHRARRERDAWLMWRARIPCCCAIRAARAVAVPGQQGDVAAADHDLCTACRQRRGS